MKIKFGSIVTQGSGKLGGHVYAKNRGGAYVRTNQTPSNPQTAFQQFSRNLLTQFSQGWSALTEAQRSGWNAATDFFQRTDQFGDVRKLSGKNLYTSLNKVLAEVGVSAISDAPTPEQIGDNVVESALFDWNDVGGSPDVVQLNGRFTVGEKYVILATPTVSAGTNFVKNKLRVVGVITASLATNLEISSLIETDYIPRFGVPAQGSKLFLGAYAVNSIGQRSPSAVVSTNVEYI